MMNNRIHIYQYEEQASLITALGSSIVADLEKAIALRGYAVLMVSGGSTPKPLFKYLREAPIAWQKVRIGLCDERWVGADHTDSNEHLIRENLLTEHASKAEFIGLYFDKITSEDAQYLCSQRVKKLLWPIDVAILGMGEDGHTASLFPYNPKLSEGLNPLNENLCIAITPQSAPHPRMSLTLSALLSVNHLYLHFEGEKKRAVFEEALKNGDHYAMPIRSLLHQDINDIEVYYA